MMGCHEMQQAQRVKRGRPSVNSSQLIHPISSTNIHITRNISKQSIVACFAKYIKIHCRMFATNPHRKRDETAVSIGNNLCLRGGAVVSLANIPETAPRNCPFRTVLQCLFWCFACFRTAWSGTKDDWGHAHWHSAACAMVFYFKIALI